MNFLDLAVMALGSLTIFMLLIAKSNLEKSRVKIAVRAKNK